MWAVMAWLQILAKKTEEAGKLVSVEDWPVFMHSSGSSPRK